VQQDVTGTAAIAFNNVEITNATLPVSVNLEGVATLNGLLTLGNGSQLDADGSGDAGVLTLLSTGDEPSTGGRIGIIPATAAVTGQVTVQRFMRAKGKINRYISMPVSGAAAGQLSNEGVSSVIRYYDEKVLGEASLGYKRVGSTSTVLTPGRGYLVTSNATIDALWDVRGPLTTGLNQGDVNLNVTHTVSNPPQLNADGWNLVGNPYPCGIGWGVNAGWQRDNIAPTIYVRDMEGSPYYQSYTFNALDGTGDLPNGIVALGQAFWVYAEAANTTVPGAPVLIVNESAKVNDDGGTFYRRATSSTQLKIALTDTNGAQEKTFLKLNPEATEEYDNRFDAYQLKNDFLNIALRDKHSRPMLMHTLSTLNEEFSAPLDIAVAEAGEYMISFDNVEQFLGSKELFLIDDHEQMATRVTPGASYSFYIAESSLTDASRFRLSRKVAFTEQNEPVISVYPNPVARLLNVRIGKAKAGSVKIVDLRGNVVMDVNMADHAALDISHLTNGVYFVKVMSNEIQVVTKIVKE
jgi:hypothetical protein